VNRCPSHGPHRRPTCRWCERRGWTPCRACGRAVEPELACVHLDTPTCSSCCGCDPDHDLIAPAVRRLIDFHGGVR
jgi:hypothetical protein